MHEYNELTISAIDIMWYDDIIHTILLLYVRTASRMRANKVLGRCDPLMGSAVGC